MAKKPTQNDVGVVCETLGLLKFRRKFYDHPPITEWRLLDSVGAHLIEASIYPGYDGDPLSVSIDRKTFSIETTKDVAAVEKYLRPLVEKNKKKLTAKKPTDKEVWKWLSQCLILEKSDLKHGTITYRKNKNMMLLESNQVNLCWAPMVNGSEDGDCAGSSTAAVGQIGMTLDMMAAWFEKQGVHKK